MATSLKIADEPLFTADDPRFKEELIAQYNANVFKPRRTRAPGPKLDRRPTRRRLLQPGGARVL